MFTLPSSSLPLTRSRSPGLQIDIPRSPFTPASSLPTDILVPLTAAINLDNVSDWTFYHRSLELRLLLQLCSLVDLKRVDQSLAAEVRERYAASGMLDPALELELEDFRGCFTLARHCLMIRDTNELRQESSAWQQQFTAASQTLEIWARVKRAVLYKHVWDHDTAGVLKVIMKYLRTHDTDMLEDINKQQTAYDKKRLIDLASQSWSRFVSTEDVEAGEDASVENDEKESDNHDDDDDSDYAVDSEADPDLAHYPDSEHGATDSDTEHRDGNEALVAVEDNAVERDHDKSHDIVSEDYAGEDFTEEDLLLPDKNRVSTVPQNTKRFASVRKMARKTLNQIRRTSYFQTPNNT
ncbi:uncharacterized protein V1518DRAFT_414973 [Limtongia smithiae]|uniref:uncharacterized protein n=1 Tax=Limtongia smithiae TaxID=1125753 RepID=UPI0034CDC688